MDRNLHLPMPIDNLAAPDTLSDEEQVAVQAKLWQFLGRQTKLYTTGDSSSVLVETAEELLSSICFTLDAYVKATGSTPRLLVTEKLDTMYEGGLKIIEAKIDEGKHLWQTACMSAPDIGNISYRDTLRNIGYFWKRYDYWFFAHQIPCDIDYQLCHPVPEHNHGIEYVNEYLHRIIVENDILHRFPVDLVIQLLERYCLDYKELLINLCEPVIVNAVGLALIGTLSLALHIAKADQSKLLEIFKRLSASKARLALAEAAGNFCNEAKITDEFTREYVAKTAVDLYPRISVVLSTGNLSRIFISIADCWSESM